MITITRKKLLYIIAAFTLSLLTYLFWGPLFPWSPVKRGFQRIPSSKANVFIQNMTASDSIVHEIDKILEDEEIFHQLKYQDKVTILIVDPETSMKRFAPWLRGRGYSVSLSLANLIYIGPTARRSSFGIKTYLKHELSHMLIDQNTSFRKALAMHDQGWLLEGVAQHYSGHQFYTRSEFVRVSKASGVSFTDLREESPLDMGFQDLKYNYTYYQLFIEYLVEAYGLEALQKYIKSYKDDPGDYQEIFVTIYGMKLDQLLEGFKNSLDI